MTRWIAGVFGLVVCSVSIAQTSLPAPVVMGVQSNAAAVKQTYTDAELVSAGLSEADMAVYRTRMKTQKGQWWGHVSPAEFMMYSSESDDERKRFAKLYLESNFPKALAERDAIEAMYQVARDIYAKQIGADARPIAKRPALFINIACEDCKPSVLDLITSSESIVDIYLTGLSSELSVELRNETMIDWARSLQLDPKRITLNDDNGLYERKMGVLLDQFHLVTP